MDFDNENPHEMEDISVPTVAEIDDGFGDFGANNIDDDDFGDFGTNDDGFGTFETPPTVLAPEAMIEFETPIGDEKEELRIAGLVNASEYPAHIRSIIDNVAASFIITEPPTGHAMPKLLFAKPDTTLIEPMTDSKSFLEVWRKYQKENVYTHPDPFIWKRSLIHDHFVQSLQRKEESKKEEIPTIHSNDTFLETQPNPKSDSEIRDVELARAKTLCDIPERILS
jgi:hypothetical protein